MKTLTNHHIPIYLWTDVMSRDEMRALAKKHGIMTGKGKCELAENLRNGETTCGRVVTFKVRISFP